MNARALLDALKGCPAPSDAKHAIAGEIHGAYVGRSPNGSRCLILPLASPARLAGRVSGALSLTFAQTVHFELAEKVWDDACAVVECADETLLPVFVALVTDLAERLTGKGRRPRGVDVATALIDWERLLRTTRRLSDGEELGLWGELAMLHRVADVDAGIRGWRGPYGELVDFVANGIGIECKTSRMRLRHHVSLDQARRPIGDFPVYVASLWVGIDPAKGQTLPELVTELESRTSEAVLLERALLSAGYSRIDAPLYSTRFVLLEDPLFFVSASVPTLVVDDPAISDVRYVIQLDELRALDETGAAAMLREFTPPP